MNNGGIRIIVPHFHIDKAHKTLSVILTLDDNNKLQIDRIRKIELHFLDKIRVGFINGQDILHALKSTATCFLIEHFPPLRLVKQSVHI